MTFTRLLPGFLLLAAALAPAQQPNVVVIISDDAGFADWGFMDPYTSSVNPGQASSPVPTPHLDALRNRGVLLTNAYTASVCSPSRAAIVTGSYQNRIGYEYNINNRTSATAAQDGLTPDTVTIFDRMKGIGYTTGAIGKWHLGAMADNGGSPGNRPPRQGVDEFFGIWKGSRNYTVGGVNDSGTLRETTIDSGGVITDTVLEATAPWNGMNVTNVFGQGAVDFIDRHYQDSTPFFLYVAFTAPHGPIHNSPDINDPRIAGLSGNRKKYASMVLTMDKEIGRILDKIEDPAGDGTEAPDDSDSLTGDTLVIFINDNGGASGNGTVNTPLRGFKGSPWEGGTRVPIVVAGAGLTAAPGATYHKPVHSIDILPTCVEAGGGATVAGIDGINLLPFLNGTDASDPHDVITIRSEDEAGVRMGDWKLVKNGRGSNFTLYNLAGDIAEGTNVAGANPAIVTQLQQELTKFEAGCDKPRHSKLGQSANTINDFDQFALAPGAPGGPASTGPNLIDNPGFESGTQADADARFTFAELDAWTHDGDGASTQIGAIDDDPQSGSYRGVFVSASRIPHQVTGHLIAGGETMFLDFWHKGKSGWDPADTIDVQLFYLDGGSEVVLSALTVNPPTNAYQNTIHLFPPISDPAATGKNLGIRFLSNAGGSEFVSIDDVFLSTGTSGGGGMVMLDWSEPSIWEDPSGSPETLLDIDSFPGCILEFPTRDDFSYTATNDMTRPTGLDFMLNKILLSGPFAGGTPQVATIDGNPVLFTGDLSANAPAIEIAATGADFSYGLGTDLVLFDDLDISGDGDATVEITGSISEDLDPRGITKTGTSTVLISGPVSYTGPTVVNGGQLLFDTAAAPTSSVTVDGGSFGGQTTVGGDISGSGTLSPGLSIGTLGTTGNVSLAGSLAIDLDGSSGDRLDVAGTLDVTGATLEITVLPGGATETAYIIATYGSRAGTFATVTGLPAGYTLDYTYDDGGSMNNVALVSSGGTPYDSWIAGSGLGGPDAAFDADPNRDGVPNGLAFITGALDADTNASRLLPTAAWNGANFKFTFRRADVAASLAPFAEYGSDLLGWTTAEDGSGGVTITVTDDGFGAGIDEVTVLLPASLAADDRFFLRLAAAAP